MYRLSKMLFPLNLLHSLTLRLKCDSQHPYYNALKKNADLVQQIVEMPDHKHLDIARQHLSTLHHINQYVAIAYTTDKHSEMQQISAILQTWEEDFIALLHGASLTFLFEKAN